MGFESAKEIEAWLVKSLSEEAEIPIEDIDPGMSFAALGIDSIESVSLASKLDAKFDDFTVKPELFWEVDSIRELAAELFARCQTVGATRQAANIVFAAED
jgi:acyl carrier protein